MGAGPLLLANLAFLSLLSGLVLKNGCLYRWAKTSDQMPSDFLRKSALASLLVDFIVLFDILSFNAMSILGVWLFAVLLVLVVLDWYVSLYLLRYANTVASHESQVAVPDTTEVRQAFRAPALILVSGLSGYLLVRTIATGIFYMG